MTTAMLRILALGGLSALVLSLGAAESVSERIDQAAKAFEDGQDREFKSISESLDRWRAAKRVTAQRELLDLFDKASAADKPFVAYHLLSLAPRHKAARELFAKANQPAPFTESGAPVAGAVVPLCQDAATIAKVDALENPPFSEVAKAVSPKGGVIGGVKIYWDNQFKALGTLRTTLGAYAAKGQETLVYPMLAYYWPDAKEVVAFYRGQNKAVPRQREWLPPLDRYLLEHELAGIDCLDKRFKPEAGGTPQVNGGVANFSGTTAWRFPQNLRNCRIEGVFTIAAAEQRFTIADAGGRGVTLAVAGRHLHLSEGGGLDATTDLDRDIANLPMQLEVRGKLAVARVAGVAVLSGELGSEHAWRTATVTASDLTATVLRVRYLGEVPEGRDDLVAAKPVKPATDPWVAERDKQLDKPVTFRFEDTSVEEVAALLAKLGGAPITFDDKADPLKSLPVTFSGTDMKLRAALDWLGRVSDLSYVPTAEGITLTWKK